MRTSAGYSVLPEHDARILRDGGHRRRAGHRRRPRRPRRHAAARARAPPSTASGARLVSICTGSFLLAALGRLDGRPATTHWMHADRFRALFPAVRLDPDVLYVDDGDVLTSAGNAAGIDLLLHLLRRDHGPAVANRVARRSVVAPWRDGGQSQFAEPLPERDDTDTGPTRTWALARLAEPLTLDRLAAHAAMSVRTFTRRFREETGQSPAALAGHPARGAGPAAAGDHRPPGRAGRRRGRVRHRDIDAPAPARGDRRGTAGLPAHLPRRSSRRRLTDWRP